LLQQTEKNAPINLNSASGAQYFEAEFYSNGSASIEASCYLGFGFVGNAGSGEDVKFNCSLITEVGDILGYTDSEYVSAAVIQNFISNYKFESTSGWKPAILAGNTKKPTVENKYGRFVGNQFYTITDDFLSGAYNESLPYYACMKLVYNDSN
jgi:hypothetical protein